MTDQSAEHWYPTAAYLYVLHLDGPTLAWEYLRRNPGYRRVMYAVSDLDAWADARSFEATSDPEYAERHAGDYRDGR